MIGNVSFVDSSDAMMIIVQKKKLTAKMQKSIKNYNMNNNITIKKQISIMLIPHCYPLSHPKQQTNQKRNKDCQNSLTCNTIF